MAIRKSWKKSAVAACCFNVWLVNQTSLQIAQPCGQVFDIIIAVLSFLGFYTLAMSVFALYFWHKGEEFK